MRVVIVGSGAREHALAHRLAREAEIVCVGGNAGTAEVGANISPGDSSVASLTSVIVEQSPGLVVVGPEAPLCAGLADALRAERIDVFGPSAAAARLEGSKAFAKEIMHAKNVPTAKAAVFGDAAKAERFVRDAGCAFVVKADGLAAGKGVVVAETVDETLAAVKRVMVDRALGEAGATVLLEEVLTGPEISVHALCDGERFVLLGAAQDHKRAYDGDRGPNTGGMGAYGPPPMFTDALREQVARNVIRPTLDAMRERGAPFRGVLFVGLMLSPSGPKVLEYNVRFGDPEATVLMSQWDGDALPYFVAAARGSLESLPAPALARGAALAVVLTAGGYPAAYARGKRITGVAEARAVEGVTVFHAGTRRNGDVLTTNGGRVLAITGRGDDVAQARARAYQAAERITFEGVAYRRDIGYQAVGKR